MFLWRQAQPRGEVPPGCEVSGSTVRARVTAPSGPTPGISASNRLTGLRDIEAILESQDARRYHSGLPAARRTTLGHVKPAGRGVHRGAVGADPAGERQVPPQRRRLRAPDRFRGVRLNALSDEWSRFSADLCGAKAHVICDPDADCPLYLAITAANINNITAAQAMPIEPGAAYVFDLGYYEFAWWGKLDQAACRIVTRLKSNTKLEVFKTRPIPAGADNILSDEIGFLPKRTAKCWRNPMADAVREFKVTIENRAGAGHSDQRS